MSVTIATNQVQQKFDVVFDQVLLNEDVIVERCGAPQVAIISYARYARLLRAEQELLRQRLQQAANAVTQRAAQVTEADIDELIEEARDES